MGRGQFGFNDNKGAARENYGIRGSYNPHAFLSPSRGGPRDGEHSLDLPSFPVYELLVTLAKALTPSTVRRCQF